MTFHVGDTEPNLSGVLTSNGQPVDLTNAQLEVHVRQPDETVLTIAATPGEAGAWSAPWPAPITQSGQLSVEVQVTYSDDGVQTFGPQTFLVYPQIA